MAYEVTATRRRPQKFEDLVGQEFVSQTFKNSIDSGKIAHAYLFSGPRGCGKTSTARILAKALNCVKGPTSSPCGECAACKEITAGSSSDVIEIDGASNTSVNDVRQIKEEVLFPPTTSRYKVYIIDEVHMLSNSAFNALLKTIEEPPAYAVFIFATTELHEVPATIKSRCQQFNFRLVPVEKVKEQLAHAAEEIGIKADDEALYWIARESTGSMRDSYTLFDQVAAFSDGEITYEKIKCKLGLVGVDALNELFELCVNGNSEEALLKIDDYLQNGVSIEQLILNCTNYIRSLLLIKNGITREALIGNNAERYSKEVLGAWSPVKLERALSIFLQLYRDVRYSLSPRFELELAISRMCWLKDYVSSAEVKKAVDAVKPLLKEASYPRKIYVDESGNNVQPAAEASSVNDGQPASQAAQRPVNGMPTFSALSSGPAAPQGVPSFKSGGAEPPVNKSAMGYNSYDDSEESDDGYVEEETETDALVSSQDMMESAIKSYEEYEKAEEKNTKPKETETVTAPADVQIDPSNMESLKNGIIAKLSYTDALLASALMQTENWVNNGTSISAVTRQKFESLTIKNNAQKIGEVLSAIYGKPMGFNISFEEISKTKEEVKLPEIVTLIRDEFRGIVMGY